MYLVKKCSNENSHHTIFPLPAIAPDVSLQGHNRAQGRGDSQAKAGRDTPATD
jgi:hypothetical protein